MSRILLGLRLARRDLRRAPLRTLLVVALVALPTTAMAAVVILLATSQRTPQERWEAAGGSAELQAAPFWGAGASPIAEDALEAMLPDGAVVVRERYVYDRVGESTSVQVTDRSIDAPSSAGLFRSVEGTGPATAAEAAISAAMADELDLAVGDTFHLGQLDQRVTVTAVVDPWSGNGRVGHGGAADVHLGAALPSTADATLQAGSPLWVNERLLVDLPDGMLPAADDLPMADGEGRIVEPRFGWYEATGLYPADLPELAPIAQAGWQLTPIDGDEPELGAVVNLTYLFGSVGLVLLGTIVTAAFAVGARRQLRSLGLLTCAGAPPAVLRWYLIAQGVVAGFVGSLAGIVVAAIGVHLLPDPLLRFLMGHAVRDVDLPGVHLVPVLVLGTAIAAGAAAIPAWTAARVPTLAALAGRRPQGRVPAWIPVLGVVAVGGGCVSLFASIAAAADSQSSSANAAILLAVGGSLLVVMGSSAMAPTLVGALEQAVGRATSSWRLAGRSLARSRVRSSSVVAAVVAATILVVAASTLLVSLTRPTNPLDDLEPLHQQRVLARDLSDEQLAEVTAVVPDAAVVEVPELEVMVTARMSEPELRTAYEVYGTSLGRVAVATPEVLDLYGVPVDEREILAAGGWVVAADVDPARLTLAVEPYSVHPAGPGELFPGPDAPGDVVAVPAPPLPPFEIPAGGAFDSPRSLGWEAPRVLVAPSTAETAGLTPSEVRTLRTLELDAPIEPEQRAALDQLAEEWQGSAAGYLGVPTEDAFRLTSTQIRMLVLAGVFLSVLAVVAIGLLLAARDSRDEAAVLSAVGAPPAVIRRVGAARAVLLVLVAVVLALPVGTLAAWSLFTAVRDETTTWMWYPTFEVDVPVIVFVVLMAPLVGAVTWIAALVRDAVRPPRPVEMGAWE